MCTNSAASKRSARSHRSLPSDTRTQQLDVALDPGDRAGDRPTVGRLDLRALIRRRHRPQRRDGLRRAERHVDSGNTRPVPASAPQLVAVDRRGAAHQRSEIFPLDGTISESGRVRRAEPESRASGLGQASRRRQTRRHRPPCSSRLGPRPSSHRPRSQRLSHPRSCGSSASPANVTTARERLNSCETQQKQALRSRTRSENNLGKREGPSTWVRIVCSAFCGE